MMLVLLLLETMAALCASHRYTGSCSRTLLPKPHCSLLLVTGPDRASLPMPKVKGVIGSGDQAQVHNTHCS